MIMRYGMSKELGALTFGHNEEQVFLGRELGQNRGYSEEVAAAIDREARKMMDAAYERCTEILTEHIDKLHVIAKLLYEKETMEAQEFLDIMNGRTLSAPEANEIVVDADAPAEAAGEPDLADTKESANVTETKEEGVAGEIKAETVETTGSDDSDETK